MKGISMYSRWRWWLVCGLGMGMGMGMGIGAGAWAGVPHLGIERVDGEIRVSWTGTGFLEEAVSVGGPWTEVAGARNPHVVSAKSAPQFFRVRAAHALTVERSGTGYGRVRSNPGGIDCGLDCTESFDSGTRVVLEAVPEGGSTFEGWTGDCAGTGPCGTRAPAGGRCGSFEPTSSRNRESPPQESEELGGSDRLAWTQGLDRVGERDRPIGQPGSRNVRRVEQYRGNTRCAVSLEA